MRRAASQPGAGVGASSSARRSMTKTGGRRRRWRESARTRRTSSAISSALRGVRRVRTRRMGREPARCRSKPLRTASGEASASGSPGASARSTLCICPEPASGAAGAAAFAPNVAAPTRAPRARKRRAAESAPSTPWSSPVSSLVPTRMSAPPSRRMRTVARPSFSYSLTSGTGATPACLPTRERRRAVAFQLMALGGSPQKYSRSSRKSVLPAPTRTSCRSGSRSLPRPRARRRRRSAERARGVTWSVSG